MQRLKKKYLFAVTFTEGTHLTPVSDPRFPVHTRYMTLLGQANIAANGHWAVNSSNNTVLREQEIEVSNVVML